MKFNGVQQSNKPSWFRSGKREDDPRLGAASPIYGIYSMDSYVASYTLCGGSRLQQALSLARLCLPKESYLPVVSFIGFSRGFYCVDKARTRAEGRRLRERRPLILQWRAFISLFGLAWAQKWIIVAGSLLLIACNLGHSIAHAQESFSSPSQETALPNEPQAAQDIGQSGGQGSQQPQTADISGTVLDANGGAVEGATVTVAGPYGSNARSTQSGNNGQFSFTDLPAGVYKITVMRPGMSNSASTQIPLHEGEVRILPPITLSVAGGVTTVIVSGDKEKLAEEQVQIAVQQRVAGVIPNFYSTSNWNAPPMGVSEDFACEAKSHNACIALYAAFQLV